MSKVEIRSATRLDLEEIWDQNIQDHPGDERWVSWKAQFISDNESGKAKTFVITNDGTTIGEATLLFSSECKAVQGRSFLADNESVANINALRIQKAYEGLGHVSKLISFMEAYIKEEGYQRLTIGVEAKESRNLAIYLHWGYDIHLGSSIEDDELILYYAKDLGT